VFNLHSLSFVCSYDFTSPKQRLLTSELSINHQIVF